MNPILRIVMFIGVFLYFVFIFLLLKKNRINIKYSLLWQFSGVLMLLVVIFPEIFRRIFHMMGIVELTNGVFAISIFLILIILMSITGIVSNLNNRSRKLVQKCSLYEKRIRELEKEINKQKEK